MGVEGRGRVIALALLIGATSLVAFANGANDNFKPVATLYGSGLLGHRAALELATAAQVSGSLVSAVLASSLVGAFGGKGLVPDAAVSGSTFVTAVAFGAAGAVLAATRLGLPVSTTHGLVGGLVGAGLALAPAELRWEALGWVFVLPLLVSPLFALVAAWVLERLDHSRTSGVRRLGPPGRRRDRLHLGSSFTLGFARGLNDTPKILALLVAAGSATLHPTLALVGIAVVMAIGGWLGSRRVARTMARGITEIRPGRGLIANGTASVIVIGASLLGMPVSTTHVTTGAILGIGLGHDLGAHRASISRIVLAWVGTLPLAGLLAYLGALLFG